MRFPALAAAVLAVLLAACVPPASAQSARPDAAEEIETLFSGLCLAYLGHGEKMLEQVKSIGAKPLPQAFAQFFLSPHKGAAWTVQGRASLYMLGLTTEPSCLIAAPEADGVKALQRFAAGPRRLLVTEGIVDGQFQQVYAVIKQDALNGQHKKMAVIATISPQEGTPGIILKALPNGIAKQIGIVIDQWPE